MPVPFSLRMNISTVVGISASFHLTIQLTVDWKHSQQFLWSHVTQWVNYKQTHSWIPLQSLVLQLTFYCMAFWEKMNKSPQYGQIQSFFILDKSYFLNIFCCIDSVLILKYIVTSQHNLFKAPQWAYELKNWAHCLFLELREHSEVVWT